MGLQFTITDNSGEVLKELEAAIERGLTAVGQKATTYVAALTPVGTPESTGVDGYVGSRLRNSMTYRVLKKERVVIIGSAVPYAAYVELGTGIYATNGNGRKSPWVWKDKNGKFHWTRGIKPQHMLQRGITEHLDEYSGIIRDELKG